MSCVKKTVAVVQVSPHKEGWMRQHPAEVEFASPVLTAPPIADDLILVIDVDKIAIARLDLRFLKSRHNILKDMGILIDIVGIEDTHNVPRGLRDAM